MVLPPWLNTEIRASDPTSVVLAANKVQFFWFFAYWDGASQAMASIVHALEEQYGEKINFIYLDVDDPGTQEFRDILVYRGQPQYFLLDRQGGILKQWSYYVAIEAFIDAFDAALR